MNSSKLVFVGKYAKKSPKKSPNRKSKSKYEDIELGSIMRTSKNKRNQHKANIPPSKNNIKANLKENILKSHNYTVQKPLQNKSLTEDTHNSKNQTNLKQINRISKKNNSSIKKIHSCKNSNYLKNQNQINKKNKSSIKDVKVHHRKSDKNSNKIKTFKNHKKSADIIKTNITNINRKDQPKDYKTISVNSNLEVFEKIDNLYCPTLFKKNIDKVKYYNNFPIEDKYLLSIISSGIKIIKIPNS